MTMPTSDENVAYWNSRAKLGPESGTHDLIAVELERRAISRYVRDGMKALDVGCGNGGTLFSLGRMFPALRMVGIDSAKNMIDEAEMAQVRAEGPDRFIFTCTDLRDWSPYPFDLIYSQRCIINLPDWPSQRAAIERIIGWLRPGGKYLMVENLQEGVDEINGLRYSLGLPGIVPPWHNRYLRLAEIRDLAEDIKDERIAKLWDNPVIYSDMYYFLSRVVNAALAKADGKEPAYDSPVNLLALDLPGGLTTLHGQGVMWVWDKM